MALAAVIALAALAWLLADSLFGRARARLAAAGAAPSELLLLDLSHVEVLHAMGTDARAESLYARILAQRDQLDDERSIVAAKGMMQLGFQALYGGDAARAEPLIAGALELRRQVYGDMHSDVGLAMSELAAVQWSLGRHEEALSTRTRAVEILRQMLGADHPEYATRLGSLGVMLSWRGDIEEAIRTFVETERIQRQALGEEHYQLAVTRRNLGRNLMAQGRYEEALPVLRAALSSWIASMGDRDFFPSQCRLDIAVALAERGQRAAADSLVAAVLAEYRARPPRGTAAGDALVVQARLRALDGRIAEAADLVRAALADYDEKGIGDNLARAAAELQLGRYLIELGDAVEAERRLRAAHDAFLAQRGPHHPQTVAARELLQQLEPVSQR